MLSNYVLEIPNAPSKGYVLLHDTLTGKDIAVHKSVYIALKRGDEDKLLQLLDAERRLLLSTFIVRDMVADKSRLLEKLDEMRSSSKTLAISLLLTTECNFACVYCHEYGVFQSIRTASHVEAAAIMDWIVAYAETLGVDRILCYFYGGEPLINLDLLVFAGSRLKQRALESGIRIEFDMSTNGSLLSKETAEVLLSMGLKTLQVSVDGPSEYHDSRKPLRGGGGLFEIDELLVIEPDISRYPAFFPESRLFVSMVAEQYGLDSLLRLYRTLPYNEATIDSVAAVLGESPEVFRNRWNYVLHKAVSEEKRLVRRGKRVERG